jgi:hypothetical protein
MNISNIFAIICSLNFVLLDAIFSITKQLPSKALFCFGAFFLLLPIILLISNLYSIKQSVNCKKWPHVRGRISEVECKRNLLTPLRGERFRLIYDYYVKDKLHSNDQFNPNKANVAKKDLFHIPQLRRKDEKKIIGTYVKVFFNPEDTWESFICNKVYFEFSSLLLPSLNALIITWYIF